jgi:hypothetical protein
MYTVEYEGGKVTIPEALDMTVLQGGKIKKLTAVQIKRGDLLRVEGGSSSIPYSQLKFFWNFLKKFPQNQVRPREHERPKLRFTKTRYSRVYHNIGQGVLQRHILWFEENIERGLYGVSALHIAHRLKEIANTSWAEVKSVRRVEDLPES